MIRPLLLARFFAAAAFAIISCAEEARQQPAPAQEQQPAPTPQRVVGARMEATMLNAVSVRLSRVANPFGDRDFRTLAATKPAIAGYPIREDRAVEPSAGRARPSVDGPEHVRSSRTALYLHLRAGLRLTFERAGDAVHVLICFKCGDLSFRPSRGLGEPPVRTGWGFEGGENVTELRNTIYALIPP